MKKHDFDILLLCALRYALGRRSYITWTVSEAIIDRLSELDDNTKRIMSYEIEKAIREDKGESVDMNHWIKLYDAIKKESKE